MVEIGKTNQLEIAREVEFGFYLDGENLGEILLPKRYVQEGYEIGSAVEVFIYLDSEDRLIATTEKPMVEVGQFAVLEVVAVTKFGAFLNWGLTKDLLVPFREQHMKMEVGKTYVVYVYLDLESQRIAASSKVEKFLDNVPVDFEEGEEVDLIIYGQTDLGYKAIVDEASTGIVYKNEVFQKIKIGQQLKGFIKKVREDEKIDLSINKPGVERFDFHTQKVLDFLRQNNGYMSANDKTSPEIIYEMFEMSKKNFKKALGSLYKQKLVAIEEEGVRLLGKI